MSYAVWVGKDEAGFWRADAVGALRQLGMRARELFCGRASARSRGKQGPHGREGDGSTDLHDHRLNVCLEAH